MAKYIATNEDEEATHTAQQIDFDEINAKLMGNIEAHCHDGCPAARSKVAHTGLAALMAHWEFNVNQPAHRAMV